ncbi:MAG TPA: hypothetical protein VF950_25760 [Planctomycetota bacterium]
MRFWPLLLILAACSPRGRERIFVPSADPVPAGTGRMNVKIDGACELEACAESIMIDVPRGILIGAFAKALEIARQGGAREFAILVDTPTGSGAVPFPLYAETSGIVGTYSRGKARVLWGHGDSNDALCAFTRVGLDGDYQITASGPANQFYSFTGLNYTPPRPPVYAHIRLEEARFVLLKMAPDDRLEDVVLSLRALEERAPGKVVLELSASH